MTFSEDDIRPYKEIPYTHTAAYFKTIFMQLTMLGGPIQESGGLVTHIVPDTLSWMAVLDMSDCISDPFYQLRDFEANFEQVVKGADPIAQGKTARMLELKPIVLRLFDPDMAEMKTQVEQLITDELKATIVPNARWIKASLLSKATALADFRLKEKLGEPKPGDYSMNHRQYEYCVYLSRLIGGFDSSTITKLIFSYNTPFHEFERTLQEHTQLCIIPPNVVQPPNLTEPTNPSPSDPDLPSSAAEPTTYTAYGTTWVKASLPLTRAEKGYTVKDGPWHCRITSTKGVKEEQVYSISDETSYLNLRLKIEVKNRKDPKNQCSVMIMHSKERAIWDDLQPQRKKVFRLGGDGDEDEDDDEDISGETYWEWVTRTRQI